MTERPPTPESKEFFEEELRLINGLKEKGAKDPEVSALLNAWLDAGEARVMAVDSPVANIEFNLKQAKLYDAAGLAEEALQNAEAAMEEAASFGEADLWEKAKAIRDTLKT